VSPRDEASTTSDLPRTSRGTVERWSMRGGLLLLTLVVAAGAVGLLGPRKGETSASAGGLLLEVQYPAITRAGEPAPLHIRVTSADGFDGTIRIGLCDDLFDDLDFQNWYPNPSGETGDATGLVYEFDPPDGDVFETSLDARSAPGAFGEVRGCTVSVLEKGAAVVSASFRTWRMP
jgi:hypothetical protein